MDIEVYKNTESQCSYCLVVLKLPELELDHIKPRATGGTSGAKNLTLACRKCNSKKSSNTVEDFLREIGKVSFKKTPDRLVKEIRKRRNTMFEGSEYKHHIRITPEDLEYLKKIRGKLSIARKLQEIIKKSKV